MPMIVGGVVLVAAIAGGVVFMKGGSSPAATPSTAAAVPAGAPAADPVAPAPVAAAPAPLPAVDTIALAKSLRTALQHASGESTARKALAEADDIQGKVTRAEDKVMLAMIRAQAYGTLGQDKRSCEALREGAEPSRGTGYESTVTQMLALCK
jgi:hypothetical protein